MESIRLFKAWLSLLTCLLISLNMWAQDSDKLPDIPILENVSINPQTGEITISWSVITPQKSSVKAEGFLLYWRETVPDITNYVFATIKDPDKHDYTFKYEDLAVGTPKMPDPRDTTVTFSVAAMNWTEDLRSPLSDKDGNIQLKSKYDSCRAEIRLNWHPYTGWLSNTPPFESLLCYYVMRIPEGGGPEELIKRLGDQDTSYVVKDVAENEKYTYYIKAERSDDTTATSYKTTIKTTMPIPPQFIKTVSTKYNSDGLPEISFQLDPDAETFSYELLGSSKPDDYSLIPLGTFDINDNTLGAFDIFNNTLVLKDIQTRERTYYYKLAAWHVCKNKYTAESDLATALWLSLRQEDQINLLQWDPYKDWGGDVKYELHRQIGDIITTFTNLTTTVYRDDLSGVLVDGDICYRVTATPASPDPDSPDQHAASNDVCIQPESDIFIPQAFTPNGDGQNDEYKPFFSYPPQKYTLHVYDRTGAKVFQTEDFNAGWNGRLKNGKPANEGVYVYYLKYRTVKGRLVEKKGVFNLIIR